MPNLNDPGPTQLTKARNHAHRAAQHVTAFARANLDAAPDDSHSSLTWNEDTRALESQPVGDVAVGLKLEDFALFVRRGEEDVGAFELAEQPISAVADWLDRKAEDLDLELPSTAEIPYDLPSEAAELSDYRMADLGPELPTLAEWFALASDELEGVKQAVARFDPGPSPVRCWPHHFDIATYVTLEEGDPETARGIGIGMSPGDEAYDQPYFYINPWPHLSAEGLPEPPAPGHWHTGGFVGLIATGGELVAAGDPAAALERFLTHGVAIALSAQGIE